MNTKKINKMDTNSTQMNWNFIYNSQPIDRKEYEENLKKRQEQHLDNINNNKGRNWRPCMHDSCSECIGTGVKKNGGACIHFISCPCPKCSPSY